MAAALSAALTLCACAAPTAARRPAPVGSASAGPGGQGRARAPGAAPGAQPTSAGLSAPAIRAVVGTHARALQACYEHALQDRPKLSGLLVVRVPVNPDGSVSSPTVDASSRIPAGDALSRCVLALVAGWRFPRPARGDDVELVLPFAFKPKPATGGASGGRTTPSPGGR